MSASKRDALVQNALKSFYQGGFTAIGMDRLARETGVSKTAIYKHFRTKDDLILATLRLRDEQFRNWLVRRVESRADTPRAQLLAVFDVLAEWFHDPHFKGCMFVKASAEFQDRDDPIHKAAAEHKRLLFTYLRDLCAQAGMVDPEQVARQLALVKEGAIVLAHLTDPDAIAADARQTAEVLVNAAVSA